MLFETTAVCAALAAKEELMTLNAVDRLIAGPLAFLASRLQPVQDVENVGARLKHFGVGLISTLRLDHVGQFGGQVDRRAFEGGGLDRTEACTSGSSHINRTGGGGCLVGAAIDGAQVVRAHHIGKRNVVA